MLIEQANRCPNAGFALDKSVGKVPLQCVCVVLARFNPDESTLDELIGLPLVLASQRSAFPVHRP